MARLARVVVPGVPHHVTQRGNGRQRTFFGDEDYRLYLRLLGTACRDAGVAVWAWCLMPNHVHLVLVPEDAEALSAALARVHRAYAGSVHARLERSGHFWQGRFGAVALDEAHLAAAVRYVLLNPVRAGLAARAVDWPWSSVHAHLGHGDGVTETGPIEARYPGLAGLLDPSEGDAETYGRLRRAESVGRPLGDAAFLARLEAQLGRPLAPRKRGPRPRGAAGER